MKLVFYMSSGINQCQVVVVRHAQSDSKQQVVMNLGIKLIRINLGMNLTFCIWLGIHR